MWEVAGRKEEGRREEGGRKEGGRRKGGREGGGAAVPTVSLTAGGSVKCLEPPLASACCPGCRPCCGQPSASLVISGTASAAELPPPSSAPAPARPLAWPRPSQFLPKLSLSLCLSGFPVLPTGVHARRPLARPTLFLFPGKPA